MRTLFALAAAALLAACASAPPFDPTKATADQLKALAADRSAVASCSLATGPWGALRTVFLQLDKATLPAGAITADTDCKVQIQADPKAPTR